MSEPPVDVEPADHVEAKNFKNIHVENKYVKTAGHCWWKLHSLLSKEISSEELKNDLTDSKLKVLQEKANEYLDARVNLGYGGSIVVDCVNFLIDIQEISLSVEDMITIRFKTILPVFYEKAKTELQNARKSLIFEFEYLKDCAIANDDKKMIELCTTRLDLGVELNDEKDLDKLGYLVAEVEKLIPGVSSEIWTLISKRLENSRGKKILWSERSGSDRELSVLQFIKKYYKTEIGTGFFTLADLRKKDMRLSKAYENYIFNIKRDKNATEEEVNDASNLVPRARRLTSGSMAKPGSKEATPRHIGNKNTQELNRIRAKAWRQRIKDAQPT